LEKKAEQVLPGSKVSGREGKEVRSKEEKWPKTMCVHMNK
jgi:hypothetical protein